MLDSDLYIFVQKLDQESVRFKLDANQMQSRCNKDATQKKLQFRWNLDATKMQIRVGAEAETLLQPGLVLFEVGGWVVWRS